MGAQLTYTKDEMIAIVQWIRERQIWLQQEQTIIECGDDFAHSNGKWPTIRQLRDEETALTSSLKTALAQLEESK